jgi:hypothetical protein
MSKTQKPKLTPKSPLAPYLEHSDDPIPKTIRAPYRVWVKAEALAAKYGCSVNEAVVAALAKAVKEEGV